MSVMYKNKLNGNYDVERKSSAWFTDKFLESFDSGEYHAQDGRLKPWYGVFDNNSNGMIWATPEKRKAIEQADYYARIL